MLTRQRNDQDLLQARDFIGVRGPTKGCISKLGPSRGLLGEIFSWPQGN